ncbi:MAG: hypothetical protein ACRDH5_06610 [bacterium]
MAARNPMRWPAAWTAGRLDEVQGTPIDGVITGDASVAARARQMGLEVSSGPVGVKGLWPGVRRQRARGGGADAGPTGSPWVDSNGWLIRLERLKSAHVLIASDPPQGAGASAFVLAVADAAAYGGRWVVNLGEEPAVEVLKRVVEALLFF